MAKDARVSSALAVGSTFFVGLANVISSLFLSKRIQIITLFDRTASPNKILLAVALLVVAVRPYGAAGVRQSAAMKPRAPRPRRLTFRLPLGTRRPRRQTEYADRRP